MCDERRGRGGEKKGRLAVVSRHWQRRSTDNRVLMSNNLFVIERRVAKVGGIYGDMIPSPSPPPYSCAIDLLPLCKELSLSQAFLLANIGRGTR